MNEESPKVLPHPRLVKIRAAKMMSASDDQSPRTNSTLRDSDEILFRRLDTPVASWTLSQARWAVEYWRTEMAFPVAQAWVYFSPAGPYLDWLHVMDSHRRRGIGRALFLAIRHRWPNLDFDPVTEDGKQFLSALSDTAK